MRRAVGAGAVADRNARGSYEAVHLSRTHGHEAMMSGHASRLLAAGAGAVRRLFPVVLLSSRRPLSSHLSVRVSLLSLVVTAPRVGSQCVVAGVASESRSIGPSAAETSRSGPITG